MSKYYDYNNSKFGSSTNYIYGDEPKVSYGTNSANTCHNPENHYQNHQSTNYYNAFCKTVFIVHGFFLLTVSIFFLIDFIINNDLYMQSITYKELLIRDTCIVLIILLSWYILMIPILIIVLYNKKHDTDCYKSLCHTDSVLCCCECLTCASGNCNQCVYECCIFELLCNILNGLD